jgi:plasmid stabilization system protein ParE
MLMTRKIEIVWSSAAARDLEQCHLWLVEQHPHAARWFRNQVRKSSARLKEHPESGVIADDVDEEGRFRHLVFGPYRLFYIFDRERVLVVRLWDARRDPNDLSLFSNLLDDSE